MNEIAKTTTLPYRIAPFFSRYLAFIIDYFTISFFAVSLYPLFLPDSWDSLSWKQLNLYFIPLYILYILLFLCKDIYKGQSWGKYFTNLQVRSMLESFPPTKIRQTIIRNLWLLLLPFELFFLLKDTYFRRKGDYFAHTVVLEYTKKITIRLLTLRVLSVIFLISFFWLLTNITMPLALKKRSDYQFAVKSLVSSRDWQAIATQNEEASYAYWFTRTETKTNVTYILPLRLANQTYLATIVLLPQNKQNAQGARWSVKKISITKQNAS